MLSFLPLKQEQIIIWECLFSILALISVKMFSLYEMRLISFLLFEVCVGSYWCSSSTLRSIYIPNEVRVTIVTIFRMPLNLIVLTVLYGVNAYKSFDAWIVTYLLLLLAMFAAFRLYTLSPNEGKKAEYNFIYKLTFAFVCFQKYLIQFWKETFCRKHDRIAKFVFKKFLASSHFCLIFSLHSKKDSFIRKMTAYDMTPLDVADQIVVRVQVTSSIGTQTGEIRMHRQGTVSELREEIYGKLGIPVEKQSLEFDGINLNEADKTTVLSQLGLKERSIIKLARLDGEEVILDPSMSELSPAKNLNETQKMINPDRDVVPVDFVQEVVNENDLVEEQPQITAIEVQAPPPEVNMVMINVAV
ncbi:hypothetical protein RFI_13160 [Reticulomyxa filosa]|uniref:Ubiquitin-like domain-containing protein n=1 Tax=Reticulomyxa filosa TaxID=46433 RepID=X6NDM5_RETFI|nr:hypothetical protein RFI_13160 [Reticulomyxa filosa]|eukprot:ETO23998.1 hypothetical protein RFI_13160 [Reticulomyxa filosa]